VTGKREETPTGIRKGVAWIDDHWRLILVALVILMVVALVIIGVKTSAPVEDAQPAPTETVFRDWPVPVDQMPPECFDMLDRGKEIVDKHVESNKHVVKAMQLFKAEKYDESGAEWDKVAKADKAMQKALDVYVARYNKCLDA
jgi:hypothetical protein